MDLKRIRKYISVKQAEILAHTLINSQFNYCPLIWKFNSIHKRTLRVVYKEFNKDYDDLLRDHSISLVYSIYLFIYIFILSIHKKTLRGRLHENRIELKPVWNLDTVNFIFCLHGKNSTRLFYISVYMGNFQYGWIEITVNRSIEVKKYRV